MIIDVATGNEVERMPTGTTGQMSFHRLANEVLRMAGEIRPSETVTHFDIDPKEGVIKYLVERHR